LTSKIDPPPLVFRSIIYLERTDPFYGFTLKPLGFSLLYQQWFLLTNACMYSLFMYSMRLSKHYTTGMKRI